MWKKLIGLVMGVAQIAVAAAHGYLAEPSARNVQHNSDYCPQCLSGPGVCGDPRGQLSHEPFGKYASPPIIAAKYPAGGTLKAKMVITANHQGRWYLELCPLKNTSPKSERSAIRNGCLEKLRLANGKGQYVYISSSASTSSGTFQLPKGVTCGRCVLRWVWETSNTCNPKGMPKEYSNQYVGVCRRPQDGEQFRNCADIQITS